MRTNESTAVTLDTVLCLPLWNLHSDTTLLVSCSTGWDCTVNILVEYAYRESVTCLSVYNVSDLLHECRSKTVLVRVLELSCDVLPVSWNLNLGVLTTSVDSSVVHVHDVLTLLAVALHDSLLHVTYSLLVRDDACDLEECRLEDCVCTSAESDLSCDLCRVDDIEGDVLLSDDSLYMVRNSLESLFLIPEAVEKECTVLLDALEYIILGKV